MNKKKIIIKYQDLKSFSKKILIKANFDKNSAKIISDCLCETSLRGVDSHGIRLLNHYIKSTKSKIKNINPKFKIEKKFPSVSVLDADGSLGHISGYKAIELAIKDSKKYGISMVVVKNSRHPGALASIAIPAAKKGFAAFAFTNADSLMLSFNGKKPLLGTNPICFVCPNGENEPFCLDMSTTAYTFNKLLLLKKNNKKLPINFAADKFGNMTLDPNMATSLYPSGGYKGFGLSIMVEILTAIFGNMPLDYELDPMYAKLRKNRQITQTYILFNIDAFTNKKQFIKNIKKLSKKVRSDKKGKKSSLMPNDPENIIMKERFKKGIPLTYETFNDLSILSNEYSVKLKLLND